MAEIIYVKFWKIIKLLRRFGKLLEKRRKYERKKQKKKFSVKKIISQSTWNMFEYFSSFDEKRENFLHNNYEKEENIEKLDEEK